ncbi:Hypothetical predicted protein [Olea europaea subsp. europaea]|uniref:Uncharacterized protein n=1 Tax=Olea europaea subsp. europaea TaxID=158383 RepID=A0A8S0R5X1_OLEEU|nr:Hypothetical predicted protein [Olea europaea subsp. europaea]
MICFIGLRSSSEWLLSTKVSNVNSSSGDNGWIGGDGEITRGNGDSFGGSGCDFTSGDKNIESCGKLTGGGGCE